MDSSSAAGVLQETRQHAAQITGHVGDFRAKVDQFEHTIETRFAAIQHAEQALLQHLQAERDRARAENQTLQQAIHDALEWLGHTSTTLGTDVKALSEDLVAAEHGSETASTALQQAVDHLAQLTTTANQHLDTFTQHAQTEVDHAHDQVHEQLLSTLGATQQQLGAASTQHETAVAQAFHQEFHNHQNEFHHQAETIATQAAHAMHDRAGRLHADVAHDVDNLHQHQDQHHQDLLHKLESVKQDLTRVGSLVTDTAHGLADGVDASSMLVQQTNLGVEEILKIIQNIESIFQDIIGSMN
jgi:F0F1-type ATP synthase membrane subunit b/b'